MTRGGDMWEGYGDYIDLAPVRRALVIIFRNIGDVLLTTPIYRALKQRNPRMAIDALVNAGTEAMLHGNPNVSMIHVYRRGEKERGLGARLREEWRLLREIRSGDYDLVINLTSGDRGRMLGLLSGAPLRVGPGRNKRFLGKPLLTHVVTQSGRRHYVERHLDCVRRIGVFPPPDDRHTELYEGETATREAARLLEDAAPGLSMEDEFILMHPTSRWLFKCWPYERAAELINRMVTELGLKVVLSASPDAREMEYASRLRDCLNVPVADLSGRLSLPQLAALIRAARLFVGVDSAPMHMAAAVGTPAVAIFGPSSETDWRPWGEGHTVVAMDGLSCRPCQIDGCGGSKVSECLVHLPVGQVLHGVRQALNFVPPGIG